MKSLVKVPVDTTEAQAAGLAALQSAFAAACNLLAPRVAEQRCWNRVALHHLSYKDLRDAFPDLGSQMACNAIHAVCRAARLVYQHPASPFNVARLGGRPLPRLQFTDDAPVYFDRHTLSLKGSEVSLFTLAGRVRCPVRLSAETTQRLRTGKLREVVLTRHAGRYRLTFALADETPAAADGAQAPGRRAVSWPPHLSVIDADAAAPDERRAAGRTHSTARPEPHP